MQKIHAHKAKHIIGYCLFIISLVLLILAFNPIQNYAADLIRSFRFQLLAICLLLGITLLLLRALKLSLIILIMSGLCLHPWYSNSNITTDRKTNYSTQINIKQINLSYSNQHVENQFKDIITQQWDILILQEFNDRNRNLLQPFLKRAHLFGYKEVEGSPYGIVVVSRLPILLKQQVRIDGDRLGYIKLQFLIAEKIITGFIAHPPSPRTEQKWQNRNLILNNLKNVVNKTPSPWFISGDLNTVPWSHFYYWQSHNSCYNTLPGYVTYSSLGFIRSTFTSFAIDHCIVDASSEIDNVQVSDFKGSDHQLLSFTINIK